MIYEIHPLIMQDAQTLVQALVTSKLDYGNVLYFCIFKSLLHKLQLVQNATACLFCGVRKYDQITRYSEHYTGFPSNIILNIRLSFSVSNQYMDLHQAISLIYYSYRHQLDHSDQTHLKS